MNLKQLATLQDKYFKPEGSHVHVYTANLPEFSPGTRTHVR